MANNLRWDFPAESSALNRNLRSRRGSDGTRLSRPIGSLAAWIGLLETWALYPAAIWLLPRHVVRSNDWTLFGRESLWRARPGVETDSTANSHLVRVQIGRTTYLACRAVHRSPRG